MKSFYVEAQNAFMRYFETPTRGDTIVYLPAISFSAAASFFEVLTHPAMPEHRAFLVDYLGSGTLPPDLLFDNGVGIEIVPDAGHGQLFENLDGFVDMLTRAAFNQR